MNASEIWKSVTARDAQIGVVMATATKRIDSDVRDALASIQWEGNQARLTCGQLDRKVYVKLNAALESLGGEWNRKAKAHVFDEAAHDELEAMIELGEYVDRADLKQIFGEFETPDDLADEVVRLVGIDSDDTGQILEPSAGSGQLLRAVERIHGGGTLFMATAVEIQEKHQESLSRLGVGVHITNFLQWEPEGVFDRVVMNPPFARQADIDHVTRAFSMLREGGRLVAIMSSGWTFRTNRKSVEFQELVTAHGSWYANPEGSFESSGTGINTVMVQLQSSL